MTSEWIDNLKYREDDVDSREAKEILWLYRRGIDDADPQFTEALNYAKGDAEVRLWLDEQSAVYAALRAKAKEIPVPDDLQDQILAKTRFLEPKIERPVVWWRSPFALGAAAVLVIGLSVYAILFQFGARRPSTPKGPGFAAFRDEMVYYAAAGYKMDVKSSSLDELRQQFVRSGWPSDYTVPLGLIKLSVRGGCLMKWQGNKVSMLCLRAPNGSGVWMYVLPRTALSNPPPEAAPQIATQDDYATAGWSAGDKTYLLAAKGDEKFVRSLL
jgi:hypothetical protein